MKRKRSSIVAMILALLVLVSTTVPVLAQNEGQETAGPKSALDALAILAPRRAPVGEEVTMTVFQRSTQDPVKDAGVWALTRENAELMKQKIAELKAQDNTSAQELDWESLVSEHGGFLLGTTQGNGRLEYTFTKEGRYHLIALKEGYNPGRTYIAIRAIRNMREALILVAPRKAPVGEEVSMTVFQRSTLDTVKDTAIWALTRENAELMKQKITELKAEGNVSAQELDWESLVSEHGGFFLGTTQGNGRLEYTFTEEGRYLLIALKPGYNPGRTGIVIKAPKTSEAPEPQTPTQ